jgi:hypothetical protein
MNIKKHHFAAASQCMPSWLPAAKFSLPAADDLCVSTDRMSVEDLEKNRYGLEIARLNVTQAAAKRAQSFAKPGIVTDAVIADIKVRR